MLVNQEFGGTLDVNFTCQRFDFHQPVATACHLALTLVAGQDTTAPKISDSRRVS